MAVAAKDSNNVNAITGLLNTNGSTVQRAYADATSHSLSVQDATTGSDAGNDAAKHDSNNVPTWIAVSEVDGITPVPIFIDSSNQLLIDSS